MRRQILIQQQLIDLEDAIDLRNVNNIKFANQLLKIRRKKKQDRDLQIQQQNIQAQAQANAQTQQAAAQMEIQKSQTILQGQAQMEQMKAQLDSGKMQQENALKKDIMFLEHQMNLELKSLEVQGMGNREREKEDRKDQRTKIQATQQSELIDQRKNEKPPKNFETPNIDMLDGGFDLGAFDPR